MKKVVQNDLMRPISLTGEFNSRSKHFEMPKQLIQYTERSEGGVGGGEFVKSYRGFTD